MRQIWNSFVIAFSMYSKIPMPQAEWNKENMKYAMCFFPVVGVVIGAFFVLWSCLQSKINFGNTFSTAVYVMIPVLITGGIHLDGLLDTSDALSSYKPMEDKLKILKDSHAGAFAIIVGICYFICLFAGYSEVTTKTIPILAVGFVLSRAFSGLAVVSFRMAKDTGLAATFSDMAVKSRVKGVMLCYIIVCGCVMILIHPALGGIGFLMALGTFGFYRHMAYQKFGGITGDLAGFFLQICELAMALGMAVAGKFF